MLVGAIKQEEHECLRLMKGWLSAECELDIFLRGSRALILKPELRRSPLEGLLKRVPSRTPGVSDSAGLEQN